MRLFVAVFDLCVFALFMFLVNIDLVNYAEVMCVSSKSHLIKYLNGTSSSMLEKCSEKCVFKMRITPSWEGNTYH